MAKNILLDLKDAVYIKRGSADKIVVTVPHAGAGMPRELLRDKRFNLEKMSPLEFAALNYIGHDPYADEIYSQLTHLGPVYLGEINREFIDFNRMRDHDDIKKGSTPTARGFIENVFKAAHSPEQRAELLRYHDLFHDTIRQEILRQRRKYGEVFVLTGHSMGGSIYDKFLRAQGESENPDNQNRPDICVSGLTLNNADERYIRLFCDTLNQYKHGFEDESRAVAIDNPLNIKIDFPFKGSGAVDTLYGRPEDGFHCVQTEVNIESFGSPRRADVIKYAIKKAAEAITEAFHLR